MIIRLSADKANQSIYVNRLLYATQSNRSSISDINSKIYISGYVPELRFFAICNMGEIIVFDRSLSNKEIDDVEKYLCNKWSIF